MIVTILLVIGVVLMLGFLGYVIYTYALLKGEQQQDPNKYLSDESLDTAPIAVMPPPTKPLTDDDLLYAKRNPQAQTPGNPVYDQTVPDLPGLSRDERRAIKTQQTIGVTVSIMSSITQVLGTLKYLFV
jgi:hypothetical protein